MNKLKEALAVITSAWSVAIILLFLRAVSMATPDSPEDARVYSTLLLILFVGAVTGSGWLWFRWTSKRGRR